MKLVALKSFRYDHRTVEVGERFDAGNKPALARLLMYIGYVRAETEDAPKKRVRKKRT